MIIDAQTLFTGTAASPAQTITATAASTNIYDNGAYQGTVTSGGVDIGPGNPLYIFGVVTAAFDNLTSLDVAVQTATDSAFTTPITISTKNYLLAKLTAGAGLAISPLAGITGSKRFLRLYFTVNGTAPDTGAIEAGIVDTLQANASLPDLLGNT